MIKSISSTNLRNNTEEAPFDIMGVSTEHENYLRFNMIVDIHFFVGNIQVLLIVI